MISCMPALAFSRYRPNGLKMTCTLLGSSAPSDTSLPLVAARVRAGFPSPADDYLGKDINLHHLLIEHPAATFLMRVEGDSMREAGIHDGDIIVVDRAIDPTA